MSIIDEAKAKTILDKALLKKESLRVSKVPKADLDELHLASTLLENAVGNKVVYFADDYFYWGRHFVSFYISDLPSLYII